MNQLHAKITLACLSMQELKEFVNTRLVIVVSRVHTSVGIVRKGSPVMSTIANHFTIQSFTAVDAYGKKRTSRTKHLQIIILRNLSQQSLSM